MAFVPVSTENIAEKIDFILLHLDVSLDGTGTIITLLSTFSVGEWH